MCVLAKSANKQETLSRAKSVRRLEIRVHARTHTHTHTRARTLAHTHTHTHARTHTHTHTHTHTCRHTCACAHTCVCTHTRQNAGKLYAHIYAWLRLPMHCGCYSLVNGFHPLCDSHDGQRFKRRGDVLDNRDQSLVDQFTRKCLAIVLVDWLAYSLVQWNWFSDVTGCFWATLIQWGLRTNFTVPGCNIESFLYYIERKVLKRFKDAMAPLSYRLYNKNVPRR